MTEQANILDVLDSIERALSSPTVQEPKIEKPRSTGIPPSQSFLRSAPPPANVPATEPSHEVANVREVLTTYPDPRPQREGAKSTFLPTGLALADIPWLP